MWVNTKWRPNFGLLTMFFFFRQSDPGIEWEMEKEVESLGNIELIQGEDEDEEEVDIDEEDVDLDEEVSSKPKV